MSPPMQSAGQAAMHPPATVSAAPLQSQAQDTACTMQPPNAQAAPFFPPPPTGTVVIPATQLFTSY